MSSEARELAEHAATKMSGENAGHLCSRATDCNRVSRTEVERRWQAEHADAFHAENDYIEKHGLPLAKYRLF